MGDNGGGARLVGEGVECRAGQQEELKCDVEGSVTSSCRICLMILFTKELLLCFMQYAGM